MTTMRGIRGRSLAASAGVLAAVLLAGGLPTPGRAQGQGGEFPNRPIRLVLPFAGGTDVVARLLAQRLSASLGQQVLADQRLGAGGNIAHEAVAKAAPDG
ncbi:MAG: tripartite tricarboxylate transporter substrate-binding protein, partial [bacterium]